MTQVPNRRPPHEARRRIRQRRHERSGRRGPLLLAAVVLPLVAAVLLLGLTGGSATAASAEVAVLDKTLGHVPKARQFPADSLVYDRSGRLIADIHPSGETRLPVTLSQIAPVLQQATVDTEDRHFWSGGFIDPGRIIAAAWGDLTGGSGLQGASTITQQLAKVEYLNDSVSLARKVRELFIARQLEATMSKQQILQDYLNDIDYGDGATGIQAAAHQYFGIDASKLDLAQASLLAGLPDAPSNLNPLQHYQAAKERQQVVLESMVSVGDITEAQAEQAYGEPLKLMSRGGDDINSQPQFVARVLQQIKTELKLDPATAGLSVTTTLDAALQQMAQQTVHDQVATLGDYNVSDGALVSIDPANGNVLAYVGNAGPDVPGADIDMAATSRQPGSTFKLFTYSTAIQERKLTMLTPVLDAPFSLPTGGGLNGMAPWVVTNYDLRYHGLLPAEQALGNSLNIPAVKVELLAGIPQIVDTARALGVTTLDQPQASYTPSLTLGGYPVPLWEMAQAATAFANQGKLQPARFISSVKDGAGHELLQPPASARQVLDPGVAFIMNQILTNDANRVLEFGPHSALTLPDHVVAAKTGTTSDFKDNLTIGWTPRLVTAAWVGNADDQAMRGTTGVTGAAPIWHDFMKQALSGQPDDWPAPPADVHPATFDGYSGYVLAGTEPAWMAQLTNGYVPRPAIPRPAPAASTSASAAPSAPPPPSSASPSPSASAAPSPASAKPAPATSPSPSPSAASAPQPPHAPALRPVTAARPAPAAA